MARTRSLDTVINDLSAKLSELKDLTPEEVKEALDKINEKLSALGFDLKEKVSEAAQEVAQKVDEKLDEGKEQWAETAQETPNVARRQLRSVYIIAAGLAFVLGLAVGKLLF